MLSASNGHERVVELPLRHSAEVNLQDGDGYTALMLATIKGHGRVVDLLLRAGADTKPRNAHGRSALQVGTEQDNSASVESSRQHTAEAIAGRREAEVEAARNADALLAEVEAEAQAEAAKSKKKKKKKKAPRVEGSTRPGRWRQRQQ